MNSLLKNKLKELPKTPGVYFHKDKSGEIIYIGKAAILKNRVRQYFQKSRTRDPKTDALVAEIADVEWIVVETEIDALFLEAEMVRRYLPRYNILLRDDKSLLYVRIDIKSEHPTVTFTRRPLDDGAEYFGPYIEGYLVRKALRLLRRVFPYATKQKEATMGSKLYEQIGLDPGVKSGKTSLEQYRKNLKKLMSYLRGNRVKLIKAIEEEMKSAAKDHEFEKAAMLRNKLNEMKALKKQVLFSDREFMDISKDKGLHGLAELLGLYEDAQLLDSDAMQGDGEKRIKTYQNTLSRASEPPTQQGAEMFSSASSSAVGQGKQVKLLRRVEGYDISHMSGTDNVASMVVFTNGIPDKASYRKFKMRLKGNNDFAHMNETIRRRLGENNVKSWGLPNLFLIDGGKGQLSAAIKARDEAGHKDIPMIGIAKREEEIVVQKNGSNVEVNKPVANNLHLVIRETEDFIMIRLPLSSDIVKLLQRIRDESHRFAVSYHSVLKQNRQTTSWLDNVPGIGPATKKKLIREFGSSRGVLQARKDELVKLLGENKATVLKQYIRAEKKIDKI